MRLVVRGPDGSCGSVPFDGDAISVGRNEENDLRLASRSVSRRHCRFVRSGAGIVVEDLDSTAGVWVDGAAVRGRMHLVPGQRIEIADWVLVLEAEDGSHEP